MSKKLIMNRKDDAFSVVFSWPYNLLDPVTSANVRSNATEAQYAALCLAGNKPINAFTISTGVDSLRAVLVWIEVNQNGGVSLDKMDFVKKELGQILISLEKAYREAALQERDELANPIFSEEDEEDEL